MTLLENRAALRSLWLPIAVMVLWEGSARLGVANSFLIPPLSIVLGELASLLGTGEFWVDVWSTSMRLAAGFVIAAIIAVPTGAMMGQVRKADDFLGGMLDFLRSLPVTALIPAFILLFGLGELNKLAMTSFVIALVLTVQVRDGFRAVPSAPVDVAALYGIRGVGLLKIKTLFALPWIVSGIRVSVNLGLIVVIVVEMFVGGGTRDGLGKAIFDAQSVLAMASMWSLIVVVGVYGFLLARVIDWWVRRAAPWVHVSADRGAGFRG